MVILMNIYLYVIVFEAKQTTFLIQILNIINKIINSLSDGAE